MTFVMIIMQVVLLGLAVFGISSLMEIYKTKIRKGKAGVWEIRAVAFALSALAAFGFGKINPIISTAFPKVSVWIEMAVYLVIVYIFQLGVDMNILKQIIRGATNFLPTGNKILTDEVKRLLEQFKKNTKLDPAVVVAVLKALGFKEENMEKTLLSIGIEQNKVDELLAAYNRAMEERN